MLPPLLRIIHNNLSFFFFGAKCQCRQLNPVLPVDEESDLFTKVIGVIMRLPVAEASTADTMIGGVEQIAQALFEKKCTSAVLDRFLKYYTPYLGDTDPVKRLRALNLISIILQCYIDIAGSEEAEKEASCTVYGKKNKKTLTSADRLNRKTLTTLT